MAKGDIQNRADTAAPGLLAEPSGRTVLLRFQGAWRRDYFRPDPVETVKGLQRDPERILCDGSALTEWDSTLLAALRRLEKAFREALDTARMPEGVRKLLALAAAAPAEPREQEAEQGGVLARVGAASLLFFKDSRDSVVFVGETANALAAAVMGRARWRMTDFARMLHECGPSALPIITLLSLLVGMILAFLGSVQLKLFGAQLYVADLVAIGMVREMGALMTGVIMAGRTGASFAARLGAMTANEEVDALITTGLPPVEFLVLPRMAALLVTLPLLTLYANALGILGGALVGVIALDLTPPQYFNETVSALIPRDAAAGLIKSLVYAFVIAHAGCRQGLRCGRSAEAVGAATTRAVVLSIVGLIVWDSAITIVYTVTGF